MLRGAWVQTKGIDCIPQDNYQRKNDATHNNKAVCPFCMLPKEIRMIHLYDFQSRLCVLLRHHEYSTPVGVGQASIAASQGHSLLVKTFVSTIENVYNKCQAVFFCEGIVRYRTAKAKLLPKIEVCVACCYSAKQSSNTQYIQQIISAAAKLPHVRRHCPTYLKGVPHEYVYAIG